MSTRTLGLVAALVGSALGTWWYTSQRRPRATSGPAPRDHGTVIFDNTPSAADADAIV